MQRRKKRSNLPYIIIIVILVIILAIAIFKCVDVIKENILSGGAAGGDVAGNTQDGGSENNGTGASGDDASSNPGDGYEKIDPPGLTEGSLVLVNNQIGWDFSQDDKMISIYDNKTDSYYVRDTEVYLAREALEHLNSMMDDFYDATGLKHINIVAGYRTKDLQEKLYNDSLETSGAQHTSDYIALPGRSEHHTGLAIDMSIFYPSDGSSEQFEGQGEYSWIYENAWKYGYILRYPQGKESITDISYESWHFRYVGVAHAYVISENDMCLEEYIDYVKNYTAGGEHLNVDTEEGQYEIYYCTENDVYVPQNAEYDISGNNVDGYIVTIIK